jgi:hypothetical protein
VSGTRRVVLSALVLAAAACTVGPSAAKFLPATDPRGIAARVVTRDGVIIQGELLELRDHEMLVAEEKAIYLISLDAIRSADFDQADIGFRYWRPPDPSTQKRLRLLSRFPQGLSPQLLQVLLDARGQREATLVGR